MNKWVKKADTELEDHFTQILELMDKTQAKLETRANNSTLISRLIYNHDKELLKDYTSMCNEVKSLLIHLIYLHHITLKAYRDMSIDTIDKVLSKAFERELRDKTDNQD